MTDLRMGVYRHYRGNLYQVFGLAHDANADELYSNRSDVARSSTRAPSGERIVVVYIGLQLDEAHEGPRLAVRTLEDFTGFVHDYYNIPPGSYPAYGTTCETWTREGLDPLCHCNKKQPRSVLERFEYLGPEFRKEMLK